MKKFTFAVLLLAGSLSTLAQLPDPILINEGLIAGKKASNSDVMVYRGIPYAAPPIANNRWRPPNLQPVGQVSVMLQTLDPAVSREALRQGPFSRSAARTVCT